MKNCHGLFRRIHYNNYFNMLFNINFCVLYLIKILCVPLFQPFFGGWGGGKLGKSFLKKGGVASTLSHISGLRTEILKIWRHIQFLEHQISIHAKAAPLFTEILNNVIDVTPPLGGKFVLEFIRLGYLLFQLLIVALSVSIFSLYSI